MLKIPSFQVRLNSIPFTPEANCFSGTSKAVMQQIESFATGKDPLASGLILRYVDIFSGRVEVDVLCTRTG